MPLGAPGRAARCARRAARDDARLLCLFAQAPPAVSALASLLCTPPPCVLAPPRRAACAAAAHAPASALRSPRPAPRARSHQAAHTRRLRLLFSITQRKQKAQSDGHTQAHRPHAASPHPTRAARLLRVRARPALPTPPPPSPPPPLPPPTPPPLAAFFLTASGLGPLALRRRKAGPPPLPRDPPSPVTPASARDCSSAAGTLSAAAPACGV